MHQFLLIPCLLKTEICVWHYQEYLITLFRSSVGIALFEIILYFCNMMGNDMAKQRYIFQLPLFEKRIPDECGDDMERWF